MFVYRFADNPYKPSRWNSHANDIDTYGLDGVFCFDPSRPVLRCFGEDVCEEELNEKSLWELFPDCFFGNNLNLLDIDESEVVSSGYGRYANFHSDNWEDYVYIPEVFVVFGEY